MKLIISESPHLKTKLGTKNMIWEVVLALLPAIFASIYFFGWDAIRIISISLLSCLLSEHLVSKIRKRRITLLEGSAVVTALLYALVLPPALPSWIVALGAGFGIIFGKEVFGGLGYNIFNPALIGRAFLMAAYPIHLTSWVYPLRLRNLADAVSSATPLGLAKFNHLPTSIGLLFWGNVPGSLGETSAIAILLGGLYLLLRKIIDWRIPFSIIFSLTLFSGIFWAIAPERYFSPLFHLLAGGLMLGTFFMATDPVTTPITKLGRSIFGIGVGLLVLIIRNWGGLPEGVMYSILIMNAFTPLINRVTRPRRFGR